MRRTIIIAMLLAGSTAAFAQFAPVSYRIGGSRLDDATPVPRLASNVIIDILPSSGWDTLWLGTGGGVTRLIVRSDNTYGFESYGEAQGLGKGGTSGLLITDTLIFAAFAFDTTVGISGAGGGLAYSRDGGRNWTWLPQPRDRAYDIDPARNGYDRVLGYWPTTTNVDNITYDIAMSDSFIWIGSKGGGLRRHAFATDYTDYNDTTGWRVVSPDTFPFHPVDRLNHRVFSLLYVDGALYVGTAGGINKTTDNGATWRSVGSGGSGISGNFVTALGYQSAEHAIWAATWRAENENEFYAVSKSTDGGNTWTVHLDSTDVVHAIGRYETVRAHSFAFHGSTAYVCDDLGLWKSPDAGATWDLFGTIRDNSTGRQFYSPEIYAALDSSGRLWTGGTDGLAVSRNDGVTWEILQTAMPLSDPARAVDTYAYPNPWSPQRFGPVKLRYTTTGGNVKITIYDFSMTKVVELPAAARLAGEQYEVWDGRKDGAIVANGTYFYKIDKPGGTVWGKLIVLD
jgi:photosystem II stability/assembly factor-like uncharacterized protein